MIDEYHFGSITIDGSTYNHDIILHGKQVIKWWREDGHTIVTKDLKDLPATFDVLVIGNGASGCCKVPNEILEFVKKKGDVVVHTTADATQAFNQLLADGKDVVGAFHLTC